MKRVIIVFGIIAGLLVAGLMYLTMPIGKEKMDFELGEKLGYLSMLISLSIIFFGVRIQRDRYEGGSIGFGKGFMTGLYITLIASVIYAIGWEIYYRTAAPDFMDVYIRHYLEQLQADGTPAEETRQKTEQMNKMKEWYKNPLVRFGFTLMEILPVGLVISVVSALVLRRRRA